jgi:hypothetical protein
LRDYREDLHYSFVEYGGACITHWSFLDSEDDAIKVEKLCGKLFLIADGDTATKWKQERHVKLEAKLGERYCHLACREVENLLSPNALRKTLQRYGETDFQDFDEPDYQAAALGDFIESKVLKGNRKRAASYATNGTISTKVDFCDKAVASVESFDDLSNEAKQIAKRLYDFIASNNK